MTTLTGSPALLNQCSHATQLGSPRGPHHVSPLLQARLGRDQEKALRLHVHARSSLLDLGRCFPHPCIKCHKHIVCITGNGLCHGSGIAKCDLVKYTRLQVDVVLAVGVVLCHETRVEIPQAARIAILLVLLEEGVVLQGIGQGTTTFHAKIADNEMQVKAALFLPLPLEQAQDFNCLMSVFSANIVPPLRLSLVVHGQPRTTSSPGHLLLPRQNFGRELLHRARAAAEEAAAAAASEPTSSTCPSGP